MRDVLGCTHIEGPATLTDGSVVRTMTYDMQHFFQSCVNLYRELIDPKVKWRRAATPFLDESAIASARPLGEGPWLECPHCVGRFPETAFSRGGEKVTSPGIPPWIYALGGLDPPPGNASPDGEEDSPETSVPSELAIVPMKVICKTLYGARYARPDLLRACQHLTLFFTKWTPKCDKKLFRLMCYIKCTLSYRLIGYVGDSIEDIDPHLFADADFAGCQVTSRCTSGVHLVSKGPRTCFPLSGISKRQGCVSHSTPEAEIVAGDYALRVEGLPALDLWSVVFCRKVACFFHGGNQAMMQVCLSGRNPTMRHLNRTHRVSINVLHEMVHRDDIVLMY
jgi:hypothetical protein